jgi:hypothetical protein
MVQVLHDFLDSSGSSATYLIEEHNTSPLPPDEFVAFTPRSLTPFLWKISTLMRKLVGETRITIVHKKTTGETKDLWRFCTLT